MRGAIAHITQPLSEYYVNRFYSFVHAFDRNIACSIILILLKGIQLGLLNLNESLLHSDYSKQSLGVLNDIASQIHLFLESNSLTLLIICTSINAWLLLSILIDYCVFLHRTQPTRAIDFLLPKSSQNSMKRLARRAAASSSQAARAAQENYADSAIPYFLSACLKMHEYVLFIPSLVFSFASSETAEQLPTALRIANFILVSFITILVESVNFEFRQRNQDCLSRRESFSSSYRFFYEILAVILYSNVEETWVLHAFNIAGNLIIMLRNVYSLSIMDFRIRSLLTSVHASIAISALVLIALSNSNINVNIPFVQISLIPLAVSISILVCKTRQTSVMDNYFAELESPDEKSIDFSLRHLDKSIRIEFDEYLNSHSSLQLEEIDVNQKGESEMERTNAKYQRIQYVQDHIVTMYRRSLRQSAKPNSTSPNTNQFSYLSYLIKCKESEAEAMCELIKLKRQMTKGHWSLRSKQQIEYLLMDCESHFSMLGRLRSKHKSNYNSLSEATSASSSDNPLLANTGKQQLFPSAAFSSSFGNAGSANEILYEICEFDDIFELSLSEFSTCISLKLQLLQILGKDFIDLDLLAKTADNLRKSRARLHAMLSSMMQLNRGHSRLLQLCYLYESTFSFDDGLNSMRKRLAKGIISGGVYREMTLHQNDACVVFASLLKQNLGRIVKVSRNFTSVMRTKLINDMNIRSFLPPLIQEGHDAILVDFGSKKQIVESQTQFPLQIGVSSEGFAVPYQIRVQFHAIYGQEFGVTAWIRQLKNESQYLQIITTKKEYTKTSGKMQGQQKEQQQIKRDHAGKHVSAGNHNYFKRYQITSISKLLFANLFSPSVESVDKIQSSFDACSIIPALPYLLGDVRAVDQIDEDYLNEQAIIEVVFLRYQESYHTSSGGTMGNILQPIIDMNGIYIGQCRLYRLRGNLHLNLSTLEVVSLRKVNSESEKRHVALQQEQLLKQRKRVVLDELQSKASYAKEEITKVVVPPMMIVTSRTQIDSEGVFGGGAGARTTNRNILSSMGALTLDTKVFHEFAISSREDIPIIQDTQNAVHALLKSEPEEAGTMQQILSEQNELISPVSQRPLLLGATTRRAMQPQNSLNQLSHNSLQLQQEVFHDFKSFFPNLPIPAASAVQESGQEEGESNQNNGGIGERETKLRVKDIVEKSESFKGTQRIGVSGGMSANETQNQRSKTNSGIKQVNVNVNTQEANKVGSVHSSEASKTKTKKEMVSQIRSQKRIIGLRIINGIGVFALLVIFGLNLGSFIQVESYISNTQLQFHNLNWNSDLRISMSSFISNLYLGYVITLGLIPSTSTDLPTLAASAFTSAKSFIPKITTLMQSYSIGDKSQIYSFSDVLNTPFTFTLISYYLNPSTLLNVYTKIPFETSLAYALLISQSNFSQLNGIPGEFYEPAYIISEFNQHTIDSALSDSQVRVFTEYKTLKEDILTFMFDEFLVILLMTLIFAFSILPIYMFIQFKREQILMLMATIPAQSLIEQMNSSLQIQSEVKRQLLHSTTIFDRQASTAPPQNAKKNQLPINQTVQSNMLVSRMPGAEAKIEPSSSLIKKKRNISATSAIKKLDIKYLFAALLFFAVLQIYSIVNYFQLEYSLFTVETNSKLMTNFALTSQYLQYSMGQNYIAYFAKILPMAVHNEPSSYWENLEDLTSQSTSYMELMLEYKTQFNTHPSRYAGSLYETYVSGVMEANACDMIAQYPQYLKPSLSINNEQCKSVENGMLQQGLLSALKFMFEVDKEIMEIIVHIDSPTEFMARIIALYERYNANTLNSLMLLVGDLLSQTQYFFEAKTLELLDFIGLLHVAIFSAQIFALLLTLYFGWHQFYRRVEKQLQDTKVLLDVLDVQILLENSYVLSYFKANQ